MSFNLQVNENNTILLIDDNEIDLFINEKVINAKKTGARIIKERSAYQVIENLKHAASKENVPDVIFVDLDMPEMNGFDFIELFEQLPVELISDCRVYMLTSSTHEQDVKRAAGFKSICRYLNKPLDLRELT